ncbi:Ig-like domain-containing protein [Vibrio sp. OPT18]|uniref:Ig-like domain-containing protein n=1 Tax=Vibrio sp. OPT18 TaxID=2778641 RepID=UPI00188013FD|nr:Ig-like domain-containing protein [Vibrio sp. OPT18]MBE8578642.1 Ig-like domain-containing protein [Vibrio sp. OPT18]
MSVFIHGIFTNETTTGPLAIVDVASSVVGIFGTSEKAAPFELFHTTNYDDAYALFGEGSITKALRRIHTFVPSNSVIGISLGKDADFPELPPPPETSGVTISSASASAYIDGADGADGAIKPVLVVNPKNATIRYASSNEAAATVASNGDISLVGVGETVITLTITPASRSNDEVAADVSNDEPEPAAPKSARSTSPEKSAEAEDAKASNAETLTYKLTVAQTNPEADKSANGATLSASKGSVAIGLPSLPVSLDNPNELAVNYTSSNETVAIVDNGTGEVTAMSEGTATITLSLIGKGEFASSTLSYEVTTGSTPDALLAAFIKALPLLRKAKNKFGFSAKIHLAPGILHKAGAASLAVSAVKQTRGVWAGDIPEDVTTKEEAYAFRQQFGHQRYFVGWPRPLVLQDDGSTAVDWFAPSIAGLMAQVDRNGVNDPIAGQTGYWCSPSNYPLLDIVGPSIDMEYIPSDAACDVNYLNANGIYTMINRGGWHGFGNYSTAYPASTAITSFLCVRRTADIIEESIEAATLQFLDKPMFTGPNGLANQVCGRVRDTVNDYLREKEGTALVYSNVYLLATDNPLINLQQGKIKYRYQFTPPIPLQTVEYNAEIYVEALETTFNKLIGG